MALGANLGQPATQLQAALQAMQKLPQTRLKNCSQFYRSPAIGPAGQPDYCNAVAELDTDLQPLPLLDALQAIEQAAGRVRGQRWAARVLDLDLLLHGNQIMVSERLTLPHPEIARRIFVLQALAEIAPEQIVPGQGSASDLLSRLGQPSLPLWT